jgi:hypothetical protein
MMGNDPLKLNVLSNLKTFLFFGTPYSIYSDHLSYLQGLAVMCPRKTYREIL